MRGARDAGRTRSAVRRIVTSVTVVIAACWAQFETQKLVQGTAHMKHTHCVGTSWQRRGVALLCVAVGAACAPKSSQRQTDIMAKTGKVSVSASVLRVRVNDLVDRFAGELERAADQIIEQSAQDSIRRRALLAKVDVIPAVYTAGFRADPLAAAIDVWGFSFQLSQYFENGGGRNAFGPQQPLFEDCARGLLADADAAIKAIAIRPEYFDMARARVEGWAESNPVEDTFASRASAVTILADLRSDDRNVFVTLGAVSDLLTELSEHMNTYAAQLPKQARWQAEVLVTGITGAHSVEGALGDLHNVGTDVRRVTDVLADVPSLVGTQRDIISSERIAVLKGIDDQRVRVLEYMTTERLATLAAMREERAALVEAMDHERGEMLTQMDAMRARAVDSTLAGLRDLVDYALLRVAALLVSLMVAAAAIGVIAYRVAVGHRRVVTW